MFHMMKMIQEEYEKLLTDGTLSEEEKEEVLRKVMDRQPFFMRKMLPMIMGERQKEQFDERCNEVVKSVLNSKEVQTDHLVGRPELSVQTSLSLATASIECQTELKPSCSQAVQVPSEEMIRSPSEISMVSSKLLELARGRGQRDSNVSTRTCDSDAELFEDASELPPSVPLSLSHLRRKAFMEMRSQPAALEEEQESVDCQTETLRDLGLLSDVSVATMPLLTSERSVQTQGALGWEKAVNTEMLQPGKTVSIQTDPSAGIPSWNLREVEVQTTDSYLKIARKLNALKLNRADSLHIMAVPVARTRTASEVGQKTHRSNGATPQAAANYST